MNFYELPSVLDSDIAAYGKLVRDHISGDLPKAKLKAFRVPMGIYEQRDNERYMMRIRLPGGGITPAQLMSVASIAERYSAWPLHFTTRQDVQIHYLELVDTVTLLKELKKIGLTSRGGGGNTVRNIVGSYDVGIDDDEVFDISAYVKALTTRLIAESDSWVLPRKFKIAFSGSSRDSSFATITDLGFIAKKNEKGEKGFAVYVAGGMGRRSMAGKKLFDFISHTEVYNVAKAMKHLFDKYGNRKRKHAARLRFLFEKLGKEEFIRRFEAELKMVREKKYPSLELAEVPECGKGFIELPLFLGDLSCEKARKLAEIMESFGEDTIRVTPYQNILLRNIAENDITGLRERLKQDGLLEELSPFLGRAVACAGASTCKLGICLSRGLLKAIKEKLEQDAAPQEKVDDLSLRISGCANTCGQHIIADLGFFGGAKRKDNRPVPHYAVVAGGVVEEGKTRLAVKVASLPAKSIPAFLKEFVVHVDQTREADEPFSRYLEREGRDKILELAEKYSNIPSFEENRDYYYDWSCEKVFSLADRLEGECSAGLFDLIELDLGQAAQDLEKIDTVTQDGDLQKSLHTITANTAQALLITKGLEPSNDREAVSLFRENFLGKHIDTAYSRLLDMHLAGEDLPVDKVKEFYTAVKELYDSMDDSLRFHELSEDKPKDDTPADKADRVFRDFRGVICPMNFVKTKLVLETMNTGDVLEVLLDDGEPIENVPASVTSEGHKILKQEKIDNHWSITIEKAGNDG